MVDRKKELKKWFIDHESDCVKVAQAYGCTKQAAWVLLFQRDSAPAEFLDICKDVGIPEAYLPEPTRSKAELRDENRTLKARVADLEQRLRSVGGESLGRAHAG